MYEARQTPDAPLQSVWNNGSVPLRLPSIALSPYQEALDSGAEPPRLTSDSVRFWSDYNHMFYHPRSIVQLNEYELNSSLMPFERWQTGDELFSTLDREHDLLDRDLRPFLEECDHLQGIQIFSTTDDAWGGFTSKYLERIADDLGKGCRWVFGLQDTQRTTRERQLLHATNMAQSLSALDSSASIHIPFGNVPRKIPEYLNLGSHRWQTSAMQCTAIESITLPARLRSSQSARSTFDNMEMVLNGDGKRRIVACAFSANDDEPKSQVNGHAETLTTNGHAHDHIDAELEQFDIEVFPEFSLRSDRQRSEIGAYTFSKLDVVRGDWEDRLDDIEERDRHGRRVAEGPRLSKHESSLLFPLLTSYPPVFRFSGHPKKIGVKVSLRTSTAIARQIKAIEGDARRLIGLDEREALCDGLAVMAEEYTDGWSSDDGDDDD